MVEQLLQDLIDPIVVGVHIFSGFEVKPPRNTVD